MEFFNHAESEDGPLGRVVQHVQADDAGIEIAVIGGVRSAHPRNYMQEFTVTSSLDFDGAPQSVQRPDTAVRRQSLNHEPSGLAGHRNDREKVDS